MNNMAAPFLIQMLNGGNKTMASTFHGLETARRALIPSKQP